MFNIIGFMLAGLGLFFVGLTFLTENMKQLSGRRLRDNIARWTKNSGAGLVWGGIIVLLTQSGSATTFIVISMLRTGLMVLAQALPLIIGMNLFGGYVVFLLISNIKLWVLTMLGITGLLYTNNRAAGIKPVAGALFGVCLLYLGLSMMQESVAPLTGMPWFQEVIGWTRGSYLLGFAIGAALSFLVQSSLAVVVVVVAFQTAGVFGMEQSIIMVFGANVGSSLLTIALSTALKGTSKQLAMFQASYNIFAALVMIPLFYIEILSGLPLVTWLPTHLFATSGNQIAALNLLYNTVPGLILFAFLGLVGRLLNRFWPETLEEKASKPKYLYDQAADDPATAVKLIELEQMRLVEMLSDMLTSVRPEGDKSKTASLMEAFATLSGIIKEAVSDISIKHKLSTEVYEQLNILVTIQHSLDDTAKLITDMGRDMGLLMSFETGKRFADSAVESVDAIMLTLLDVVKDRSEEEAGFLRMMTAEGGKGISGVRSSYLSEERGLDSQERMKLFAVSNLCERLILNMGKIGGGYMFLR